MTKVGLVLVVAVVCIAPRAEAQPTGLMPSFQTRECERSPDCVARVFADGLTAEPREPHELRADALVVFRPSATWVRAAARERIGALARSWGDQSNWGVITVEGYPDPWARSDAARLALAQQRAETVRDQLIRQGVAPEYIVAVPRTSSPMRRSASRVDLTITLCNRSTSPTTEGCRVQGAEQLSAGSNLR